MDEYLSNTGTQNPDRIWTGITNQEYQQLEYTVIVQVQRAEVNSKSVQILD